MLDSIRRKKPVVNNQKLELGDTVEYIDHKAKPTGVVGSIVSFYEQEKAIVSCPSGHEWLLCLDRLKKVSLKYSRRK